jgi:hypothetical protein
MGSGHFLVRAVEKRPALPRAAINSDPPGAELTIDGQPVGATPFLCELEPGEHTLVLVKAKFRTAQATLHMPAGRDVDLRYPLAPAAQPATLAVVTDPPGAKVSLDGVELGATPFIGQAPAGNHELRIELSGHQKITRQMRFTDDRNSEVNVTLLKLPAEPVIAVSTNPPGATLSIDGTDIGKTPFLSILSPGEHELTLRKEGLRSIEAQIIMPKDRDLDLRYTLEALPKTPVPPQIALSSDPGGADILIDGAKVGQTPFLQALAAGDHKVKLTREGFFPYERTIVMPKDRDMEVTLALIPLPPAPGPSKVEIATDPPGAELILDGKRAGKGVFRGARVAGDYVVEAKLAGYRSVSQKFTVTQGQSVNLKLSLTPLPKEASAPLLTVASEPDGATLLVDGKPLGKTPYQGETTPGEHLIALSLADYKMREEKFKVPAEKEYELRVNWTLTPTRRSVTVASASKKEAAPPTDPEDARKALGKAPAVTNLLATKCAEKTCPPAVTMTPVQTVWYRAGVVPWVATAVGAVTVAVGGYFGSRSSQLATVISNTKAQDRAVEATLLNDFRSAHRTSLILYGVGGGLAAGVDLYWLVSSLIVRDPVAESKVVSASLQAPAPSVPDAAADSKTSESVAP